MAKKRDAFELAVLKAAENLVDAWIVESRLQVSPTPIGMRERLALDKARLINAVMNLQEGRKGIKP